MTMAVVPALLRLRVPPDTDRPLLEALLVRAISTAVPAAPELVAITPLRPGRTWTYALLLRAASLRAPLHADYLVATAGRAADDAVRAKYGMFSAATAITARTDEDLAACHRATAGIPRRPSNDSATQQCRPGNAHSDPPPASANPPFHNALRQEAGRRPR